MDSKPIDKKLAELNRILAIHKESKKLATRPFNPVETKAAREKSAAILRMLSNLA